MNQLHSTRVIAFLQCVCVTHLVYRYCIRIVHSDSTLWNTTTDASRWLRKWSTRVTKNSSPKSETIYEKWKSHTCVCVVVFLYIHEIWYLLTASAYVWGHDERSDNLVHSRKQLSMSENVLPRTLLMHLQRLWSAFWQYWYCLSTSHPRTCPYFALAKL